MTVIHVEMGLGILLNVALYIAQRNQRRRDRERRHLDAQLAPYDQEQHQ